MSIRRPDENRKCYLCVLENKGFDEPQTDRKG